jgi:hypothetical protein
MKLMHALRYFSQMFESVKSRGILLGKSKHAYSNFCSNKKTQGLPVMNELGVSKELPDKYSTRSLLNQFTTPLSLYPYCRIVRRKDLYSFCIAETTS